jgi:four helix bundle protein
MKSIVKPRHFTDLIVWQKSHKLFVNIYKEFDNFPYKVGVSIIVGQILRSCGSISANIAEGFNAYSTKEYVRFLDIALRSAAETENWIYKVADCSLLKKEKINPWLDTCHEIEKMVQSLIKSLRKRIDTKH